MSNSNTNARTRSRIATGRDDSMPATKRPKGAVVDALVVSECTAWATASPSTLGPAPSTPLSTATGVYRAVGDGCGWTLGGRVDTDNHRDEERGDGGLSLGIVTMSARS